MTYKPQALVAQVVFPAHPVGERTQVQSQGLVT